MISEIMQIAAQILAVLLLVFVFVLVTVFLRTFFKVLVNNRRLKFNSRRKQAEFELNLLKETYEQRKSKS